MRTTTLFVLLAHGVIAGELKPETAKAWDGYLQEMEQRMQERSRSGRPFLWMDENPGMAERVRGGEIVAAPAVEKTPRHVPSGLIHDWIGTSFIPNVTMEDVLLVSGAYDHYRDFYNPTVVESRLLAHDGNDYRFSMRWTQRVLMITAAIDGEYRSHFTRLDAKHWYSSATTTQIREVADYGRESEHNLPPDQGSGYLWRMYSLIRYEERDGGVYIELEAVALSRDIPASVRWMVTPIVARLSRNSLLVSLRQTRDAVQNNTQVASRSKTAGQ